jgi:hypothetical protein
MASKRAAKVKRWTMEVPDGAIRPRGPDRCLTEAINALGPFNHELQKDAEDNCSGKRRFAVSVELAFHHVVTLAEQFNRHTFLAQGAPRLKKIVEQLVGIEDQAGHLARTLESLDDFTRHLFQTGGSGVNGYTSTLISTLDDDAGVQESTEPNAATDQDLAEECTNNLKALSFYANSSLAMFLNIKGIDDIDAPDKGGAGTPYSDIYGNPRWSLVHQAWHTFDLFKPDSPTGTEGGPFHLFLMNVFEYATNLEPEENSKLTFWLKSVTKNNRDYKELLSQERRLEKEIAELTDNPSSAVDRNNREKRREELSQKLAAVRNEHDALWDKMYPHAYRKPSGREPTLKS